MDMLQLSVKRLFGKEGAGWNALKVCSPIMHLYGWLGHALHKCLALKCVVCRVLGPRSLCS